MWFRVRNASSARSVAPFVWAGALLAVSLVDVSRAEPLAPAAPEPHADPEAADLNAPLDPEPHHLRTLGEMALGLGGFAVGYWSLQATQQPDWDYPSVSGRFDGSAWRFDNNQLIINFWLHPLAGGEMYALSRANHHGPLASAGYSTLSSFLWEFVFEYRELVSVNDLLATSFPGIAVGEFLHKLGLYLDSAERPSTGLRVAQWVLTPGHQYDRLVDGRVGSDDLPRDDLGLRRDIWHDFDVRSTFGAGVDPDGGEYPAFGLGFRGSLVSLPGYRRPGHRGAGFTSADFASLAFQTEASEHGPGLHMSSEVILAGYHAQDLWLAPGRRDPSGRMALTGSTFTTGMALAYTYLESHRNDFPELLGAFHMPGLRVAGSARSRVGSAELGIRATPDFVGVGAFGYEQWQAAHRRERGKHILRNQGYHYAWGGSGVVEAEVTLGPLELDGSLFLGRWRSQEGLNRWQERISLDVAAGTNLVWYRASARVRPGRLPLTVGANLELRRWSTFIGEVERDERSLVRGVEARFRF